MPFIETLWSRATYGNDLHYVIVMPCVSQLNTEIRLLASECNQSARDWSVKWFVVLVLVGGERDYMFWIQNYLNKVADWKHSSL